MIMFQGRHEAHGGDRDQESSEVAKRKVNNGSSSSSSARGMVKLIKLNGMTELASQKHALSERKRRKRINCHYDSLRQLFPRLLKSDKASVLAETVRRLKELKNTVTHILPPPHDSGEQCSGHQSQHSFFIPGENDETTVTHINTSDNKTVVRATICCEDRPGLNQDLTAAIRSVHGKAVKAEMATIGGRTKVEVVMEWPECGGGSGEEDVRLLKRALKAVVENRVLGRPGFKVYDEIAEGLIMKSYY